MNRRQPLPLRGRESNPYASPAAELDVTVPLSATEAAAWRNRFLIREAAIRSTGTMYYLMATLALLLATMAAINGSRSLPILAAAGGILAPMGAMVGWGLRRLDPRVRWAAAVPAVGLLVLFPPLGTAVGLLVLYLLFSPGSQPIFSSEYRRVVAQDPNRHQPWSYLISAVLLVFLLVALISPLLLKLPGH